MVEGKPDSRYISFENAEVTYRGAAFYKIECLTSGYCYIGATANFRKRIIKHRNELRRNWHPNSALQFAWNVFGEENFAFVIIEACPEEEAFKKEEIFLREQVSPLFNHHRKVALRGTITEEGRKILSEKAKLQIQNGIFANGKKAEWPVQRRKAQGIRMAEMHKEGRTNHNIAWTEERREAQRQRMIVRNRKVTK